MAACVRQRNSGCRQAAGFSRFSANAMALPWKAFSRKPAVRARRATVWRDWKCGSKITSVTNLSHRRVPIWNLAQHCHQDRPVEPVAAQFAFPYPGLQEFNVCEICGARFFPRPLQHAGLNIHGDNFAGRADLRRNRDGQPARTAADIEHGHARPQIQALYDGRCSIRLCDWIVQLDHPAQPCRAWDRTATRREPPDDGAED